MKHVLATLVFLLPVLSHAESSDWFIESGDATKRYVQERIVDIQQLAAQSSDSQTVTFDKNMICLSSYSYIEEVGLCQATGELDGPNTSSTFVITVAEKNPGSGDGQTEVQVKRMVTQIPRK